MKKDLIKKIILYSILFIIIVIGVTFFLCICVNPIDPNVMINNFTNVNLDDRVVNLGLGRTATSSLADALVMLGYKVWHGTYYKNLEYYYFNKFNALTDTHTYGSKRPDMDFKRIHKDYPNTKFILTLRDDPEEWYKSVEKIKKEYNYIPGWADIWTERILGESYKKRDKITKDDYLNEYNNYNKNVKKYFKENDPDALLVFNVIDKKDNWKELCDFLNKKIPNKKYPKTGELDITFKLSANKFFGI